MHVRPALTSSPTPCIQVVPLLFAPALLLSTTSHLLTPIDTSSTSTPPPKTTANMPSQLVSIVTAVVVSAVLILVVVGPVVAMVTVALCRRLNEEHVDEYDEGMRSQRADDTLTSTIYYELMSPDVNHTHIHHQPHPLHAPHTNTTSDNGDHITMQDCPAYQPIEDTPISVEYAKGDHIAMQDCPAYQPIEDTPISVEYANGDHISMQDCPAYQSIEDTPTSVTGDCTYIS